MGVVTQGLLWSMLVVGSLFGWGAGCRWICLRCSSVSLGAFEMFGLGIAVEVGLTGWLTAFGIASASFFNLFVAGGLAIGLTMIVVVARTGRWAITRQAVAWTVAAAFGLAAVWMATLVTVVNAQANPCDDPTYLYLARRLVVTGNLADPFNNRRLTSLGGMSGLQAVFLVHLPSTYLNLADVLLGSILLGLTFITVRGRINWWGLLPIAVLLVAYPIGRGNSSPIILPVGLSVLAFRFALRLRAEGNERSEVWTIGVLLGVAVGAAASLRPQFAVPLMLLVAAVVLWKPTARRSLWRLASVTIGGFAVLAGWCLASWLTDATPLYPLIGGNSNPSWPVNGYTIPGKSIGRVLSHAYAAVSTHHWLAAGITVGLVGAAIFRLTASQPRQRRWSPVVSIAALLSALALLVYLYYVWWNIDSDFSRFWQPTFLAAILFPLAALSLVEVRSRVPIALLAVLTAFVVLLVGGSTITTFTQAIKADYHLAATGQFASNLDASLPLSVTSEYLAVVGKVPKGSKVLVAVDDPSQLLGAPISISTLDLAGSVSPNGGSFPFYRGSRAKVDWLRTHGYSAIIMVDPNKSSCLYSAPLWHKDVVDHSFYAAWAPYYSDWFSFYSQVAMVHGVTTMHEGPLQLVLLG